MWIFGKGYDLIMIYTYWIRIIYTYSISNTKFNISNILNLANIMQNFNKLSADKQYQIRCIVDKSWPIFDKDGDGRLDRD